MPDILRFDDWIYEFKMAKETLPLQAFKKKMNDHLDSMGIKPNYDSNREDPTHIVMGVDLTKHDKIPDIIAFAEKHGYFLSKMLLADEWDEKPLPYTTNPKKMAHDIKVHRDKYFDEDERDDDIWLTLLLEPEIEDKKKHPDELYHFTEQRYLDSIKSKGLLPKAKVKLSWHPPRIYLIKQDFIGRFGTYVKWLDEPVLLRVDTKGLEMSIDPNVPGDAAFYTSKKIPADRITVANNFET